MNPVQYARAGDAEAAIATHLPVDGARYIAGGTNVIDLMKDGVERPTLLVDISRLPWSAIATTATGVRIGALATMADTADAPEIKSAFPAVSQALLLSASAQLRNMASMGGNVLQRTRCAYFRDTTQPCNKRAPGSGCTAIAGQNRMHAVIGDSPQCICTHASDLSVALLTADAVVRTRGPAGTRSIPFEQFNVLPGLRPDIEHVLQRGELIEALELTASAHARNATYLKVRDRASYEFALVSVAAGLDVQGGFIRDARVGLGGVAPVPWRAHDVERALIGQPANAATFAAAAVVATQGMRGHGYNDFKIALTQRSVRRALETVGGAA
ncbi:MAG: xanthine dehydrogenase family protein subunit M [Candidatus Eremiobacteraeota bacterium]|nr:xanthine dehydrogenase family protein subunit M [Candidatus Eremiobacteraeota bacterium]